MHQGLTNGDVLNPLLDELDLEAAEQHVGDRSANYWVCQRKFPRYPFRAECIIRFLPQGSSTVGKMPGRTRNLSRNGIGLLVRRVFAIGDPVELEVHVPDRPVMYMAGLVSFCRYAGRGYHEVGVFLRGAGREPIFSHNPIAAMREIDWLRDATIPR